MTQRQLPLATLENSIYLQGESVYILDRRVFPGEVSWFRADTPEDVAWAIKAMVTQSSGPLFAACAGMELAAVRARSLAAGAARESIRAAGALIAGARPTNSHPREAVDQVLTALDTRSSASTSTYEIVELVIEHSRAEANRYHARSRSLAQHAVEVLGTEARILTHCWMDSYLIELVKAAHEKGAHYEWVATETRPYLQGARLTAHTLKELGQEVALITDSMAAAALSTPGTLGAISAVVTAADRVSMDGTVVNKVGTLGIAVAAHAFDVPYYALIQSPDPSMSVGSDIVIEDRNPHEVFLTLGVRTASALVDRAWYPAFDATPARFITRIVTDRGAFDPGNLAHYFAAPPLSRQQGIA